MSPENSRTKSLVILLLCLVHTAIAVTISLTLNIWVDEASTLHATQNGILFALQTALTEQKQAPLYFWIVSLWRYLDQSIFFARLFSILCSIGAILMLARLAKRFFAAKGVILVAAFAALHPFLFWASSEIRVYSLVVLLSVILISLFFEAFYPTGDVRSTRSAEIWFLIATITALYTNYYLGFLIAGFFIALVVDRRWGAIWKFMLLMLIAGLAFVPLALTVGSEMQSRNAGYHESRSIITGVKIVWNHILTFILPTEIYTPEQATLASIARLWLVRAGLILLAAVTFHKRRNISVETVSLASIVGTIAAFMVAASLLVGPSLVVIRHASILFIPVVLFAALIIRDVAKDGSERLKNITMGGAAIVVLCFFAYGIGNLYPAWTKRGDWARASRFIEENGTPGQPIAVFPVYDALVPQFSYNGPNQIVPGAGYFTFVPEAPEGSPDRFASQIEFLIAEIPKDAAHVWLSVSDWCEKGETCRPLQNYVEANYTIEIEKDFYHQKLYLLKRKSQ